MSRYYPSKDKENTTRRRSQVRDLDSGDKFKTSTLGEIVSLEKSNKNVIGLRSITERSQAPKKVILIDLFYLRGMDVDSVNIPYLLKIDDTWAWVAQGPERQQVVMAGALEVAEDVPVVDEAAQAIPAPIQAPQPPSAARFMPRSIAMIEETWLVISLETTTISTMDLDGETCLTGLLWIRCIELVSSVVFSEVKEEICCIFLDGYAYWSSEHHFMKICDRKLLAHDLTYLGLRMMSRLSLKNDMPLRDKKSKIYNNDKNFSDIQLKHEKEDEFVAVAVKVDCMRVVKEIEDGHVEEMEKLEWWFEQDIDDEEEEDEGGEGGSE
nr:hypothetical protein [Tanacetum cinerariifolium]